MGLKAARKYVDKIDPRLRSKIRIGREMLRNLESGKLMWRMKLTI
jgi:hypothetical protein